MDVFGEIMKALGGIFGVFNVPTATGQGLLKFVEFFAAGWDLISRAFGALFGGFDLGNLFGGLFG